jgi:NAD(P)H-flavin reductase
MSPLLDELPDAWLRSLSNIALRTTAFSNIDDVIATSKSSKPLDPGAGDDPGKDSRFRHIVEQVSWSRWWLVTYNLVLLGALVVVGGLEMWRWRRMIKRTEIIKNRKRRLLIKDINKKGERVNGLDECASSSGSSTFQDTESPSTSSRKIIDEETSLLPSSNLSIRRPNRYKNVFSVINSHIRSFLVYQPPPLPVIHKVLPSNSTSILVLLLLAINIFYLLFAIHLPISLSNQSSGTIFVLADRAGLLFSANLPLLYLLAAKTAFINPLCWTSGRSYEHLNIIHRRLGEWMCFLALIHLVGMICVWYALLRPVGFTLARFLGTKLVLLGLGAWTAYEGLYLSSLAMVREWFYELFLSLHIVLQLAAAVFLFLHHHTSRPYVGLAVGIWALDRMLYRMFLKPITVRATLEIQEDGKTVALSADWDIPSDLRKYGLDPLIRRPWRTIEEGWNPGDHVFISVPELGGSHRLQAHPFTIFSAAPLRAKTIWNRTENWEDAEVEDIRHAWLTLLIRSRSGFSQALLNYAKVHSSVLVKLDGPYGSSHATQLLANSNIAILVAGGSGIAVEFPLLWALVRHQAQKGKVNMHLIWVVHSRSHLSWLPEQRLAELKELGLIVHIPLPTQEAGRPDVGRMVRQIVEGNREMENYEHREEKVGVLVSGPDGMNRDVRNSVAALIRNGRKIDILVEKFGW